MKLLRFYIIAAILIIIGIFAVYAKILHHLSSAQTNITFYNSSSLQCCQKQRTTGFGNVTLNTTLIKDNSYSSEVGDLRYILKPASTFIHLSNYPNLHYVISGDGRAWLSVFADGDIYLSAHLKIQTNSNGQPIMKSSVQPIDITAFARYDLLHHLFSPIMGKTVYDTEPGFLSIGDYSIWLWPNAKIKLRTFDNGTGTFSVVG